MVSDSHGVRKLIDTAALSAASRGTPFAISYFQASPGRSLNWRSGSPRSVPSAHTRRPGNRLFPTTTGLYSHLLRVARRTTSVTEIPLPGRGSVSDVFTDPSSGGITFSFQSWAIPPHEYFFDPGTGSLRDLALATQPAPHAIEVRDLEAKAKDGVRVPLTAIVPEQLETQEFGSVTTEDGFRNLLAMDAYQNVRKDVRYPPVLITMGMNDPRVAPWQPAKLAAKLLAYGNPTLLRVDLDGGHGVGATKQQHDLLFADMFSFVYWHSGRPGWAPSHDHR